MADTTRLDPTPTRLNGWKEIANHLGKGVRTAQRWERNYRLPVHRIGENGGEIVFAYRAEIEDWLRRYGHSPETKEPTQAATEHSEVIDQDQAAPAPPQTAIHSHRRVLVAMATLVVAILAGLGWLQLSRRRSNASTLDLQRQPARWSVSAETLHVFNDDGQLLWHYPLDGVIDDGAYGTVPGGSVAIADLDGDGSRELLDCW